MSLAGGRWRANKKPTAVFWRWVVNFYSSTIQPVIAKAQATAWHSHGACFGVGFRLAMTGFIVTAAL
jgi:uncharacterized protein involved in response to NO